MLLDNTRQLFKWFIVVTAIFISIPINLAHAIFGQRDVPLEDYYNYGKSHTGVAIVSAKKCNGTACATANLVDIGVDALKGKVMITCAHVLNDMNIVDSSVRFIDENNTSSTMGIQAIYFNEAFEKDGMDIGLIVLKNSIDIEKFKPLKLNLTKNNESLIGSEMSIIGCSPYMGHAASNHVVLEDHQSTLRRGMQTLLHSSTDTSPHMNYEFHHQAGFIEIYRHQEYAAKPLAIQAEMEQKLREMVLLHQRNKEVGIVDHELTQQYFNLYTDSQSSSGVISRNGLSKRLVCDETFKNQLTNLTDADDLNKEEIINQWENLIGKTEESIRSRSTSKRFCLDKYQISMHPPLPSLSGICYHGDSGGAWVIGDEIVAVSEANADVEYHKLEKIWIGPTDFSDLTTYFATCEMLLKHPDTCTIPLLEKSSGASFGTSIWSSKYWIESTLQKIIFDLNLQ